MVAELDCWLQCLGSSPSPVPRYVLSIKSSVHWNRITLCYYTSSPCFCLVAKSCPTFCDPMDCNPPGSSVHGIFQARILEWVAISYCRESSPHRGQTCISKPHILHWQANYLPLSHQGSLISSLQFSVVTQSCPNLCDPKNPYTSP